MDSTEFTALIRRHAGLIHKIAHAYCRNATDREDVVQEIAVQLWRSRDRYDPRFRETTWIYRIALNVAISFHRRERRHHDRATPADEHAIVVEPVEPGDEVQRLLRCIDDLGPLDRRATGLSWQAAAESWRSATPPSIVHDETLCGERAWERLCDGVRGRGRWM